MAHMMHHDFFAMSMICTCVLLTHVHTISMCGFLLPKPKAINLHSDILVFDQNLLNMMNFYIAFDFSSLPSLASVGQIFTYLVAVLVS